MKHKKPYLPLSIILLGLLLFCHGCWTRYEGTAKIIDIEEGELLFRAPEIEARGLIERYPGYYLDCEFLLQTDDQQRRKLFIHKKEFDTLRKEQTIEIGMLVFIVYYHTFRGDFIIKELFAPQYEKMYEANNGLNPGKTLANFYRGQRKDHSE